MLRRWLVVAVAAVVLVATPPVLAALPAGSAPPGETVPAPRLADRIRASTGAGWSGSVATVGSLQLPSSDSFATLGTLLGERTELRAWWRGTDDWRVDRLRATGETDLFRRGETTVRWVFEDERAVFTPVSDVRLPDASDLLPPSLARFVLQDARDDELARLPLRRVAGETVPGLRLTPADDVSTVDHVDVWADPDTGVALAVEVTARGADRPVVTTAFRDVTLDRPAAVTTAFAPPSQVELASEPAVDVAAAADAFGVADLPTALGALTTRGGEERGAVGVYGRGPTSVIVVPLRGRVSEPLRRQLLEGGGATQTTDGTVAGIGPVTVLLTGTRPTGNRGAYLITGTVTVDAARAMAQDLRGIRR